jgi:hypothetical protein
LNTNSSKTIQARGEEVLVKPNVDRKFPFIVVTSIMLGNASLRKRSWMCFLIGGAFQWQKLASE